MGSKTITVTEEAYERLKAHKREGESFTDTLLRLAGERGGRWDGYGALRDADGAVMASDAFFPFPDGIEEAADAGIEAVVQPGGSVNDEDVIEAANDRDMAMAFTGQRAFKH